MSQALSRAGYDVRTTGTAASLWRWVQAGDGDLVITDVVMPDENAFELLPRIKKLRPDLPIIVMSAQNTFMTAIKASERGAYDYLPKPFDLKELVAIVGRAMAEPRQKEVVRDDELDAMPLIGRSHGHAGDLPHAGAADADRPHRHDLGRVGNRQGTGGPGAARLRQAEVGAIRRHQHGRDPAGPHRIRAVRPREGCLHRRQYAARPAGSSRPKGGTLFLDEIGDMPMEAQTRLLRVLQQAEYTTVGGRTPIKTNVRIVAATNKDLRVTIQQGLFREDLFFRLNVVPIRLPPLRERAEDIPHLARHFFALAAAEGLPLKHMDSGAHRPKLKRYRWPGNVRELENLVRRLAALYPQEVITAPLVDAELGTEPTRPERSRRLRRLAAGNSAADKTERSRGARRRRGRADGRGRAPPRRTLRQARRGPAPAGPLSPGLAGARGARSSRRPSRPRAATRSRRPRCSGLNRNTLRKKVRELDIKLMRLPR